MTYTRTLPPIEHQLGPKVERKAPETPEWVATDNPLVERNTRTGTMRTKDCRPTEDELAGLPLDIAYAVRKMRGAYREALNDLHQIDEDLGLWPFPTNLGR